MKVYDTTTGELVEEPEIPGAVSGMAVDESTNTLFTVGSGNKVRVLSAVATPKATTEEPVGDETVSGTADPDGAGPITSCKFEYAFSYQSVYPYEVPCDQALPITDPTTVTAKLAAVAKENEYRYRLVLGTATPGAVAKGRAMTIVPHHVPSLKTEAASGVTRKEATLNASFEGDGTAVSYRFEWGTSPFSYEHVEPVQSAGSPKAPPKTQLSLPLSNLTPGQTYHYRIFASNEEGESTAADRSFTTLPAVSGVETKEATGLDADGFTLNGGFFGNGEATTYYFEYGLTTEYGPEFPAPPADAGSPTGATPLSFEITEFAAYTTYHYRLVAKTRSGRPSATT